MSFDRDPLVTSHNYGTYDDLGVQIPNAGIQRVFVCGGMDETCKNFKDTWIPCHPYGTTALFQAIAYVWITEGTYDKDGINTHAIGFDEEHLPACAPKGSSYKEYVLGNSDGVPKTPEWAEPILRSEAANHQSFGEEVGERTNVELEGFGEGPRSRVVSIFGRR